MVSLRLLFLFLLFAPTERGPWLLIGRIPDRNPYTCSASSSGTYVGPTASITDSTCAVWTLGSGASPQIIILRNGSPATPVAKGSVIEYYMGVVYVKGTDGMTWYSWNNAIGDFDTYGTTDPSMGAATPIGYFVSTTGSDSNSCMASQTVTTPKRNLTGVNGAIACLAAGDTLYVRAGTYDENILTVPSGTDWNSKVRITSYPGDARPWLIPTTTDAGQAVVWLDCNCHYIEFDGINISGVSSAQQGLWTSTGNGNDPHHVRIQNAEVIAGTQGGGAAVKFGVHGNDMPRGAVGSNEARNLVIHGGGVPGECGFNCSSLGVYLIGPNNLVEDCDIYDTSSGGIQIYSRTDSADNNIIRRNRIHDITRTGDVGEAWGIIIAQGNNNQVYNNLIYHMTVGNNSGDAGIAIAGTNTKVWNNTVYDILQTGIIVGSGVTGAVVRNNISYNNGGSEYSDQGSGTASSNNVTTADPIFVANGSDFHIQSSSPARDAGTPLGSFFTTDLEAIPRPQGPSWDVGAYEYH